MSYSTIDPAIQTWVSKYGFALFDSMAGMQGHPLRCVYMSSDKGECFQIWIDQPESGNVSIHAADIETHLDAEFRKDWCVPSEQIGAALDDAVLQVQQWMNR